MDKQIIFTEPRKEWSDGLTGFRWYIRYALVTGGTIESHLIGEKTEAEARDKAQEIIRKYMETENEDT